MSMSMSRNPQKSIGNYLGPYIIVPYYRSRIDPLRILLQGTLPSEVSELRVSAVGAGLTAAGALSLPVSIWRSFGVQGQGSL